MIISKRPQKVAACVLIAEEIEQRRARDETESLIFFKQGGESMLEVARCVIYMRTKYILYRCSALSALTYEQVGEEKIIIHQK